MGIKSHGQMGSSSHPTGWSSCDEAKRREKVLFPKSSCTRADQCNPRKVILER